jgi:hypothetical protein
MVMKSGDLVAHFLPTVVLTATTTNKQWQLKQACGASIALDQTFPLKQA